jgi:translation initiation factor IF-3
MDGFERLRINRQIRSLKVRLIGATGEQVGIVSIQEAQARADEAGLDLVEIAPNATPPVCKVIDYGKYRYDQTKKEKENKKAQHQVKIKEIKLRPTTDDHDLETKLRHARDFLSKGNKVKISLMFRGREMAHPEIGSKLIDQVCETLSDVATAESPAKLFGRFLTIVLAPGAAKKKKETTKDV